MGIQVGSPDKLSTLGRTGIEQLKELPIAKHFNQPLLLCHAEDQTVDERPCASDLILNRHDQQRGSETARACETYWEVSCFLKRDIKEEMADT